MGSSDGDVEGDSVGPSVGSPVDDLVGVSVGSSLGDVVGDSVGPSVGSLVGDVVGSAVIIGDVVGEAVKVNDSQSVGQYPVHENEVALDTSIDASAQLVSSSSSQSILQEPDPQFICTLLPLQTSSPVHVISTSAAFCPAKKVFPPHAALPLHTMTQSSPVRHVSVLSWH